MLYCNDCGAIFSCEEAASRPAELEDSCSPWLRITLCPACGSESVEEADRCEVCGKPIAVGKHYCDECEEALYSIVAESVRSVESLGVVSGETAKDVLWDYIEREWY